MRVLLVAACSLTLSFAAAVGINLQKLSMTNEETRATKRPSYLQPLWCIGMTILIIDACADFVWIGLAPQSLLAPLGGLSLGFNVLLAPIFHKKEKVTRSIVTATALIYMGTILTVLFAPDSAPSYSLTTLVEFSTNPPFMVYALACIAFQGGMAYHGMRQSTFQLVHYCGLAGCFGGQTILFAKSASELVKTALVSGNYQDWTTSPLPYLFVLGMIGTVLTQVNFLNTGLAKFDALVVVPVYQSFWNAFGITGGLIFFQEYKLMSTRDAAMYACGILITLMGVAILVRERAVGGKGHVSFKTDIAQGAHDHDGETASPRDLGKVEDSHASRRRTFSEEEGTIRHRRPRTNTEELKGLM
jgi:magnesium transporter